MKCSICGESDELVLIKHHIVPRKKGGEDNPGNIVTLCRNCHWRVHSGHYMLKSGLSPLQRDIIGLFRRGPFDDAQSIASELRKSRSEVNRSLNNLCIKLLKNRVILSYVSGGVEPIKIVGVKLPPKYVG